MLQQMEDDPIQAAIRSIEKQHETDKQGKHSLYHDVYIILRSLPQCSTVVYISHNYYKILKVCQQFCNFVRSVQDI